ncbi:MAG: alpha-galactosidase [Acidobacteriia bacterium]|nr:alpha-galactosidase [Terriglobia bacterium]
MQICNHRRRVEWLALLLAVITSLAFLGCSKREPARQAETVSTSSITVAVQSSGPIVIRTAEAEFEILPSGYIRASRIQDGKLLSLDDPQTGVGSADGYPVVDGKPIEDFLLDLAHAKISDQKSRIGTRGKRIEITGSSSSRKDLEKRLIVDVYDDFPALALASVAYKNTSPSSVKLDKLISQQHHFNASLADAKVPPYQLWSFQGASYEWGKETISMMKADFSQSNVIGTVSPTGQGGGIPVVAFWTASVGEAIGHAEPAPRVLSLPVKVERDQRISAAVVEEPAAMLQPGESYASARTFVAVYAGDYYQPLRLYSELLQRQGWTPARPNPEDYNISWCGWGYRSDVTPKQMLGTIPKLKEFGIKWATLDYRWFNNFGDWEARPFNFPDDALKKLVDVFHQEGLKVQVWWVPLAVGDGQVWEAIGEEEKTPEARAEQRRAAKVVEEHPDWLILDKNGKHARAFLNRAMLCPALPAVQEYYRQITTRLIRDMGFDGSKLDMCFTVPDCYNPAHHHRSPQDSVLAMGEVFKVVYETTRQIKPASVTQICPCGTVPNVAWLPYEDQAVTADPVGSVQVRQRIKMYKALLGPQAAVYGDHVELTAMKRAGKEYREFGQDFASTVGAGGVVGTKFTWPDYGPSFKDVYLNPEKQAVWKKWIGIYSTQMLSTGKFLDLYVYGYDVPEGYAIQKNGRMFYAFFAPLPEKPWKGQVELRGLAPGTYRVVDYENGKDLGVVDAKNPSAPTEFKEHLLLETRKM